MDEHGNWHEQEFSPEAIASVEKKMDEVNASDVAGGCDVDDADRESEQVQVRICIELLDGDGELDESDSAQSQDMDREKACGVMRQLRSIWHLAISAEPSTGCSEGNIAEWVARSRETGLLNFDQLLAIGRECENLREYVAGKSKECEDAWKHQRYWESEAAKSRREADSLRALKDKLRDALAHIACLCSAIETQSPSVTNEFVENERKRARDFQESMGKAVR